MLTAIILLSIAYALIVLLLLNIGFFSRLHAGFKFLLCLASAVFLFIHFGAVRDMLGWPTSTPLPDKFLLLAAEIHEPDKETGDAGSIFMWATAIVDRQPSGEPRAYRVAYHQDLHEKINIAKSGQRKGIPQIGEVPERKSTLFSLKTTSSIAEKIDIYALPDPVLPEK